MSRVPISPRPNGVPRPHHRLVVTLSPPTHPTPSLCSLTTSSISSSPPPPPPPILKPQPRDRPIPFIRKPSRAPYVPRIRYGIHKRKNAFSKKRMRTLLKQRRGITLGSKPLRLKLSQRVKRTRSFAKLFPLIQHGKKLSLKSVRNSGFLSKSLRPLVTDVVPVATTWTSPISISPHRAIPSLPLPMRTDDRTKRQIHRRQAFRSSNQLVPNTIATILSILTSILLLLINLILLPFSRWDTFPSLSQPSRKVSKMRKQNALMKPKYGKVTEAIMGRRLGHDRYGKKG